MPDRDIAIVGAGISGLSLAFYCARAGMKTVLVERDARPGGAIHSHRYTSGEDRFWLELGAHTCYNSYGNMLEVLEACGLGERMIAREGVPFRVLVDGEVRSIFSQISYPELLLSLPTALWRRRKGATVASFYGGILGRRNYDALFGHFFNAVPSQDTSGFPADLLFKSRPRRKDVLRSYTMDAGLQTLAEQIAAVDGIEFLGGEEVSRVEPSGDRYSIVTARGVEHTARVLALATPAPITARLLQQLRPDLSDRIAEVATAGVHSVGVIVRKDRVTVAPVAGIISPNDLFYSAVSRDTVPDPRFRGFTFHFKPEITDANRRLERVCEVLQVDPLSIEDVVTKENVLPALTVRHEELVRAIDTMLTDGTLLITGNYFGGVAIEDCVSRSRSEFERMQRAHEVR